MNSFDALAKNHTALDDEGIEHVQRLMSAWGVLSDLCFADLLLFAPVADSDGSRFVVLGQARPTTSQTFHLDVLVGRVVDEFERPMVARAWRRGEIVESEDVILGRGERARVQCIPVRHDGEIVAILSRESPLQVGRRPGQLERVYVETFQRFARMITRGQFPFDGEVTDKSAPRIGDGSLLLDQDRRIVFASPNAMNAMHRMGFLANVIGSRLEEIGIPGALVKQAFERAEPVSDEVEPRLNVSLAIACLPLLEDDRVDGALVMMRDVTDLRRLDRLLHSKDATIREIHHRVKNNLQTISSLLDLQSRRLDAGPARTALEEAHRRVRSIALVHEILSRDANEQVAFNEIIEPLVRVAAQTALVADHHVEFDVVGDAGELEAAIATPLAVVLAEILANAVEHAFPEGKTSDDERPRVVVRLENDGRNLHVEVQDNGVGLPDDFNLQKTKSLGLSITHSLVTSQLQGSMQMSTAGGTVVDLVVPLKAPR
jgi:two-component system, sensor histidine kinase PdtaS